MIVKEPDSFFYICSRSLFSCPSGSESFSGVRVQVFILCVEFDIIIPMSVINQMERLADSCRTYGPLCVGLDTDPSYLPPEVLGKYESPSGAVLAYNRALVEATASHAGCYKVQIAYYEAMGLPGLKVYKETLDFIKSKGKPVISDIKRGDIADTAKAYAKAHFYGDFETDIVTLNPYMGFETLNPFVEEAEKRGKGIFALLRTSNPGMTDIEKQELKAGGLVLDRVGSEIERLRETFLSKQIIKSGDASPVGAVVGCTEESDALDLRNKYPGIFFLIPGYGAQGGAARIAGTLLQNAGGTVNSSRGILLAWKKDPALTEKREAGGLTLEQITESAYKAAEASAKELLEAKALCSKA